MKISSIAAMIVMGFMLNSCQKEPINPAPTNVGTIRFEANAYTIENNTIDPLTIVLPLSLPLEQDATVMVSVDNSSTIAASEYTITPAIPANGIMLSLPKGSTEVSFKVNSLNNFEGEKTLALKLSSATGGLTVSNTNANATINIKGNPIILPEIKTSTSGLAFGSVVTSTTSISQSYTLTGVKLSANVTITASTNFQVSLDNSNFASTVTVPFATANAAPLTIYARFNATTGTNQSISGTITHSSGTVPDNTITVSGVEYGVAAPGVLIKKEDFAYGSTADALTTASSAAWVAFSAAGSNPIQYLPTGLTYLGYIGSGVGGSLSMENQSKSSEDAGLSFTAQSSGAIYAAQLINVSSAPTSATFFSSFATGAEGASAVYYNRVYIKSAGSQYSLGTSRNASTTPAYAATNLDYGTTYLVVHKYEFDTGLSSMYVLSGPPTAIEPPTPTASSSGGAADPASLTRYLIRQDTANPLKVTVDGIRIATSWKEAVGL
ncbi:hypothetical protein WG904_04955 [Pedobacter sp. Du54]|uniref:hypothetical protein n=1 Tax=Pedobacter anseongensis TaxID=3133439 RepID=UPI00309D3769